MQDLGTTNLMLGIMAAVDGYIFYRLRRSGWL